MSIDLQTQLAKSVRKHLDAPIPGSDEQHQAILESCTTLEWMLGGLLEGADGWTRWYGIDGVLAEAVTIGGSGELQIDGWAWWGERGISAQWIEPFFASVRVSTSGNGGISYTIRFADADRGLVKAPSDPRQSGQKRRHLKNWMFEKRKEPEKWLFEFRGPPAPAG